MSKKAKAPIGITEVVLRDAHQSLFATRMRVEDMLPIAPKLDEIGFWSIESWGGATFDSCIRYLGEDPWERIRLLKKAMPKTPQQMLFRAQNILGYRHYADDVVDKFVERAAVNGVDVFRIFDALNDVRNLTTAIKATKRVGKHAQASMSYTTSPVHNLDYWVDLGKRLEDIGVDSICVKDMSGLLLPQEAFDLISRLKQDLDVRIHLHCHATTGVSTATYLKAIEAGVDNVDCGISSMSHSTGHSATESVVAMTAGGQRDSGLDLNALEEVAAYFRDVRKKYATFEGSLKGVDGRILVAQVPGGMLSNMENQLKQQGALDQMDDVLKEIPKVREDLGYLPLVTPTSQIVGTQAVVNVLTGERYKSITKETAGVLKGEYGQTPVPVNAELQAQVLEEGEEPITCRPADVLEPEVEKLTAELTAKAKEEGFELADEVIDDVLTYALFPQVGLNFLKNRGNKDAFEPVPSAADSAPAAAPAATSVAAAGDSGVYTVKVNGAAYVVEVNEGGDVQAVTAAPAAVAPSVSAPAAGGEAVPAPLAGNILRVIAQPGQTVQEGDVLVILEAMKMETEVSAPVAGVVGQVKVAEGDKVVVGDPLLTIA